MSITVTHAELLPDNKGVVLDLLYDDGYEQRYHNPLEDDAIRCSDYIEQASLIMDEFHGPLNIKDWIGKANDESWAELDAIRDKLDLKYRT